MIALEDGKFSGFSVMEESYVAAHQMGRFLSTYSPGIPIQFHPKISGRYTFQEQVFEKLNRDFQAIVTDSRMIMRLSQITKSISEYKMGNFANSLILAWFQIESILNEKWSHFLETKHTTYDDGKLRINSDRRKYLEGKDYSASIISNILELSDIIPYSIFTQIDNTRKHRNYIAHNNTKYTCSSKDTVEAIQLTLSLVNRDTSLDIVTDLSLSLQGF